MLFLGICCTEYDLEKNWIGLTNSISSLKKSFNEIFIFGIIQKRNESSVNLNFINTNSFFDEYEIISEFGTSNARNKIIEKALDYREKLGIQYLLFHDVSIRWNQTSANLIYHNKDKFPHVKFKYINIDEDEYFSMNIICKKNKIETMKILTNTYVGSYIFKLQSIKKIRFNNNFGPGDKTKYKSGEDVLFLSEYIEKNKIKKTVTNLKCFLYHPPRPNDYSKHLLYAKGQGKVFRLLLSERFNFYYLYRFILFIFNSFFRCVLCKKNSLAILQERFIGFLKG